MSASPPPSLTPCCTVVLSSSPYLLNEGHELVVEQLDVLFLLLPHGLELRVDVEVHGGQESPIDGEGRVRGASVSDISVEAERAVAVAGRLVGTAAAQAIRGRAGCFSSAHLP